MLFLLFCYKCMNVWKSEMKGDTFINKRELKKKKRQYIFSCCKQVLKCGRGYDIPFCLHSFQKSLCVAVPGHELSTLLIAISCWFRIQLIWSNLGLSLPNQKIIDFNCSTGTIVFLFNVVQFCDLEYLCKYQDSVKLVSIYPIPVRTFSICYTHARYVLAGRGTVFIGPRRPQ